MMDRQFSELFVFKVDIKPGGSCDRKRGGVQPRVCIDETIRKLDPDAVRLFLVPEITEEGYRILLSSIALFLYI